MKVYRGEGGNPDEYGPEVELTTQEVDDFARETAVASGAYAVPARPEARKTKRKESFRKTIQVDLKNIDHYICGLSCEKRKTTVPIRRLNEEYADLLPCTLPAGLPPSRKTDHAIKLTPGARPPARRIYRMSPKEELVLTETLDR